MTPYYQDNFAVIYHGDCRDVLRALPDQSVNCCVTSPPYFGLRDYNVEGQIGLEPTPEEYVAQMVAVFREVRRVLRNDGTCWLNLGDSYAGGNSRGESAMSKKQSTNNGTHFLNGKASSIPANLKPKDLIGIPWRVAFALQADGWWLRQDIIWAKPNPMPESVTDRCTKSHEYIFLMSKRAKYYFDQDAIAEQSKYPDDNRKARQNPSDYKNMMSDDGQLRAVINPSGARTYPERNRRSVWTVSTKPYSDAHFATFPPDLIEPCILAGCPEGGTVLDPFLGSGTTARVANQLKRKVVGIELNAEYLELIKKRTSNNQIRLIA